jgi:hypothetical protein
MAANKETTPKPRKDHEHSPNNSYKETPVQSSWPFRVPMESFSLYFTPYHVMLWVQHRLLAHPRHRNHSPMNFRNQNLQSTPLPVSFPRHSLIHRKQSPSPTPITACTNNHAQPTCGNLPQCHANKALSSQNSETHNFIK